MPFKHYHGRTGVVFNVTKRAIGVTVNKSVSWEWIESNEQLCIGSGLQSADSFHFCIGERNHSLRNFLDRDFLMKIG